MESTAEYSMYSIVVINLVGATMKTAVTTGTTR